MNECRHYVVLLISPTLTQKYSYFLSTDIETGVDIAECITSMPNHSEAEIRQVVLMLAEEGHVYSTISENHYKIAM